MSEIKPCPFCGLAAGDPGVGPTLVSDQNDYRFVTCPCGADGPEHDDAEDSIAAWNAAPRFTPAERVVLDAAVESVAKDSKPMRWAELRERVANASNACGAIEEHEQIVGLLADIDAAAPAMEQQACDAWAYRVLQTAMITTRRRVDG